MKKTRILLIYVITSLLLVVSMGTTYATINPGDYEPSGPTAADVDPIVELANPIIGTIKTVGVVIAVITLILLGIKYMTGSIEEKAEYKKTMIPYLIGAVLIVAITQFIGVIASLATI